MRRASRTPSRPRSARRSSRSESNGSARCRRRAARRSCVARSGRSALGQGSRRSVVPREPRSAGGDRGPCHSLTGSVAFITGGGRGIGANIARELARGGHARRGRARSLDQLEAVALETGGLALTDVLSRDIRRVDGARGRSRARPDRPARRERRHRGPREPLASDPDEWWRTFEVNVRGVYLCYRAVAPPGCSREAAGRIVIIGSGAAYLPGLVSPPPTRRRRPLCGPLRRSARAAARWEAVFRSSCSLPGLVRTQMTSWAHRTTRRGTPSHLAPRLVRVARLGPRRRARGPLHPRRA